MQPNSNTLPQFLANLDVCDLLGIQRRALACSNQLDKALGNWVARGVWWPRSNCLGYQGSLMGMPPILSGHPDVPRWTSAVTVYSVYMPGSVLLSSDSSGLVNLMLAYLNCDTKKLVEGLWFLVTVTTAAT